MFLSLLLFNLNKNIETLVEKKIIESQPKIKKCICGETNHKLTTYKNCILNKKNLDKTPIVVSPPVPMDPYLSPITKIITPSTIMSVCGDKALLRQSYITSERNRKNATPNTAKHISKKSITTKKKRQINFQETEPVNPNDGAIGHYIY